MCNPFEQIYYISIFGKMQVGKINKSMLKILCKVLNNTKLGLFVRKQTAQKKKESGELFSAYSMSRIRSSNLE